LTGQRIAKTLAARGLAIALVLACMSSPSEAGGAREVCRQEDVVDFVSSAIQNGAFYVTFDRRSIAEQPSPRPDLVFCSVVTTRWAYDSTRFQRMTWLERRGYSVRKLEHGFEVTLLR